MKKGYILTMDAIVALVLATMVFVAVLGMHESLRSTEKTGFKKIHYTSEDAIEVLNKKGVLDQVCTDWAMADNNKTSPNWIAAESTAKQHLSQIIPERMGYRLLIDGVEICNDSRVPEEVASAKTHSTRILSGYLPGMPPRAYVARAGLSNIRGKKASTYVYFGGYEGDGNITKKITLPGDANVTGAFIELNAGSDFDLYVNDIFCRGFSVNGINMSANVDENISCGFAPGENTIEIRFPVFNNSFIGGGYVRVDYNTAEFDTTHGLEIYRFPGIKGIINLYSSFYVPGILNSMEIYLHYDSNNTQFLTIGNAMVFLGKNTGEQTHTLNSADIQANLSDVGLSYWKLGKKTVPIRMGTSNISYGTAGGIGTGDSVLITDVSGSMRTCNLDSPTGPCDCGAPAPCKRIKLNVAKEVDMVFVDATLNTSGNRVGLVSYDRRVVATHPLSDDDVSLKNQITSYSSGATTCICCGINKATDMLKSPFVVILDGSGNWKYGEYGSCGNDCDPATTPGGCTPAGWETGGFDDSAWVIITLPDENTSEKKKVRYYRKHFTIDYPSSEDGTLYIKNRRGVECYLNGNFIGADTSCSDGSYWDNIWAVPITYFNSIGQDNVLSCRVRCGSALDRRGIEFDAKLIYPRRKSMLVMSDGIANVGCGGDAKNDAIEAACNARDLYDIDVYSVAFGSNANIITLKKIACWDCSANDWLPGESEANCSLFYQSNNADELKEIYLKIAGEAVNASYRAQTITVEGTSIDNILYPDSYIKLHYSQAPGLEYGEISLTFESNAFGNNFTNGSFHVPNGTRPMGARITSYSAEYWADRLDVSNDISGWTQVYRLSDYGIDYILLGDPYIVHIPKKYLSVGDNHVSIATGISPTNCTGGSPDDKAIYTVAVKTSSGYGEPKSEREGCNWLVEFPDGSTNVIKIPSNYIGVENCNYTSASIAYNNRDVISDAAYRLFKQLDIYPEDGRLDISFNPGHIKADTSTVGGVRSLWGPVVVKLVVWMK